MDYEKKYKGALEWARKVMQGKVGFVLDEVLEKFPELKESEDERIRKKLIAMARCYTFEGEEERQRVISWLEKQGKKIEPIKVFDTEFERQFSHIIASTINKEYEYTEDSVKRASNALLNYAKHEFEKQGEKGTNGNNEEVPNSAWSEEDKEMMQVAINACCSYQDSLVRNDSRFDKAVEAEDWLKSLKERVQPKPKQMWSEEDEKNVEKLDGFLTEVFCYGHVYISQKDKKELQSWLKFLKERYTWKPSEKQMDALYTYIYNPQYFSSPDPRMELVESVYQELKKLKG